MEPTPLPIPKNCILPQCPYQQYTTMQYSLIISFAFSKNKMSFLFFGAKKSAKNADFVFELIICRFFRISAAFAPDASLFSMNGRYAFARMLFSCKALAEGSQRTVLTLRPARDAHGAAVQHDAVTEIG